MGPLSADPRTRLVIARSAVVPGVLPPAALRLMEARAMLHSRGTGGGQEW